MRSMRFVPLLLLAAPLVGQQQAPQVSLGAFIDSYYAWDTGQPLSFDRAFTTQAVRHNEFNINLAHIEATVASERVRGRLALQAGTSVQANYAGEPTIGSNSGPSLARHIQEAVAGVRVAPALWVDAGIYFSHIGQESWISRDNPTYTRSFTADYTPYYSTGVKATWAASSKVTAQLHLINGWQNISENNSGKAVGARIDWAVGPKFSLGWASYLGSEPPDGATRNFQQLMATWRPDSGLTIWATADAGWQRLNGGRRATWGSVTIIGEARLSATSALALRVERYLDRDGVLIPVAVAGGFDVTSASAGLNVRLPEGVQWRTEGRWYRSGGAIWPDGAATSRNSAALVTSLSLTLRDHPSGQ
ncbi:MAG: porin [Gemmatimonadota bacterium]